MTVPSSGLRCPYSKATGGNIDVAISLRLRVKIDGVIPGADHGLDVDADGWGTVQEPRLYQLVRRSRAITDRTFEIVFLDTGSSVYALTFGIGLGPPTFGSRGNSNWPMTLYWGYEVKP